MIIILSILFTDIDPKFYSNEGKNLNNVTDTSPHLRISAACEIIADNCFYQLSTLFSFTFEENPNLTIIGNYSFYECKNLSVINLSTCTKLKTICSWAFYNCERVSEILLPRGLQEIKSVAFNSIRKLTSILIPASVEKMGYSAFGSCYYLENVIFEEHSNLTYLDQEVFSWTKISSFQIPENISKIDGKAFTDGRLTNLTIHPNNYHLVVENNSVFSANKSILYFICNKSFETYEIPESVTAIGDLCFYNTNLKFIKFSSSFSSIGYECFAGTKFTTLNIPKSVKRIEFRAFYGCNDLINVTFLGPIEYLDMQTFDYCKNLEVIIFPNSPMNVSAAYFSTSKSPKLSMAFTNKTLFAHNSIDRNTNVSISYINKSDLIITPKLFIMNQNETEIYELWAYNSFYKFIYYPDITIPKSVTVIKERAFENLQISKIVFEQYTKLAVIENYAFRNCSNLERIDISWYNLQILGEESFKDCTRLRFASFSVRNLTIMKNAFANCINLVSISGIQTLQDGCLSGCIKLEYATIIEGSKMIGSKSFENCKSLGSIRIPSSVTTISEYAFLNCLMLKSITFIAKNSLEEISTNSFSGCNSLRNISKFSSEKFKCFDNTLYSIVESKEYLILHLNNSLDNNLCINCSVICSYSFNQCNNIYNISILSNSVSLIEEYINFPLSVQNVQSLAFNECPSIQCPIHIENTSIDYLKMIDEAGIPQSLIVSCRVVHGSINVKIVKRSLKNSPNLFWGYLSK